MKLSDLDAVFVAQYDHAKDSFVEQQEIEGAQGVMFICPLCQGHNVLCWFRNPVKAAAVPAEAEPGPGRWEVSGGSLADLTLSPSVNLDVQPTMAGQEIKSCRWHGWVKNGDAA